MMLGNTRANGVRVIAERCLARDCRRPGVVDAAHFGDDTSVPSLGARMRCRTCGRLGADARPNWQERAPPSRFGPARTTLDRQ
ncbi:MAG: hypothetical protein P8Y71_08860 [Pseudolabrys sp.]